VPKAKQKTRDQSIREMRSEHSERTRKVGALAVAPKTAKKIVALLDHLKKKFKEDVLTTVASGLRASNVNAMPSGWQEVDDLITGETDKKMKTVVGTGLGWPRGRIIEIYGDEAVGKTTLALHIVSAFQMAGEEAAYVDAEHALDVVYATKLNADMERLMLSQPDSAEQALQITQELCDSGAFGVVVVDSVAALTPQAELDGDMGDPHMGLQARLMSQALRKLTAIVARSGTLLVFINQQRLKIGVRYGNPKTTTGGNALKFYASVRLEMVNVKTMKKGERVTGRRIRVRTVKNKVAPPFRDVFCDIEPNVGIARVHGDPDLGGAGD
jgi:recombination protein RecA